MKRGRIGFTVLICFILMLSSAVNVYAITSKAGYCAGIIRNEGKSFDALSLYNEKSTTLTTDYTNILTVSATRNTGSVDTYSVSGHKGVLQLSKSVIGGNYVWTKIKVDVRVYYRGRLICTDTLTVKN